MMSNLNLISQIAGRDALPIRAIPYVTGGAVAADMVARELAGRVGAPFPVLPNLVAYQLHNDELIKVLPNEWDRYVTKFAGLTDDLKSQFATYDQGCAAWDESSVSELPPGVFVWVDEFERAFEGGLPSENITLIHKPNPERDKQFAHDNEDYAAWLKRSASELHPRPFVWMDESERAFQGGLEFKKITLTHARNAERELIYWPMMEDETRAMVLAGFQPEDFVPARRKEPQQGGTELQAGDDSPVVEAPDPERRLTALRADDAKRRRSARLEGAITPKGSGSGYSGQREAYRASDFPLQRCDLKRWTQFDSLPIEQACFVLLDFEPPPLDCLKFVQDPYWPSRAPTWDAPVGYDDVLRSLRTSIEHDIVLMLRSKVDKYTTQNVLWPELIRWAKSKSYSIQVELEDIVAKMESVAAVLAPQAAPVVPTADSLPLPVETPAPATGDIVAVSDATVVLVQASDPLPVTTGDIAFCFAGLHWETEAKWKKPLGDKPKWLEACIAIPAVRGVSETRWNPVLIGAALVQDKHAKAKSVRARFQTKPQLMPWLDAWKTYEADYFPTE